MIDKKPKKVKQVQEEKPKKVSDEIEKVSDETEKVSDETEKV